MITDPLFHLKFDGNANDSSSNARNASTVGTVTYGTSPWAWRQAALNLTEVNYVRYPNPAFIGGLSTWGFLGICKAARGSYPASASFGSAATTAVVLYGFLSNNGGGSAVFAFNAERFNVVGTPAAGGVWARFGLSYTGGTLTYYCDGMTPQTLGSLSLTMPASPVGIHFGNFVNNGSPAQPGNVDWADARMYSHTITAGDWADYIAYDGEPPASGGGAPSRMGFGFGIGF